MTRWIFLALALVGCGTVCEDDGGCFDVEACIEGHCKPVDCLSSVHCEIGSYCDTQTHTCEPGCESDGDCLTADWCRAATQTCEPRQCLDTQMDCGPGERCDTQVAECTQDPKPHCEPCSGGGQCGDDGRCIDLGGGDGSFCFIDCDPTDNNACPAAYQCSPTEAGHSCLAFCPLLD